MTLLTLTGLMNQYWAARLEAIWPAAAVVGDQHWHRHHHLAPARQQSLRARGRCSGAGAAARLPVMASACGFAPCFPVRDMRAALAHHEQLGFEVMPYTQGMTCAWTRLGAAELHLFTKDDHNPATTAAAADLQVENTDELHRMLRETGASGISDPYGTPYGREFVHVDPDNNLMRFVAPSAART